MGGKMGAGFEVLKEDSDRLGYVSGSCNTKYYIFFNFKGQAVRKVRNLLVTSVIVYLERLYWT
jgi:hypothetical protein